MKHGENTLGEPEKEENTVKESISEIRIGPRSFPEDYSDENGNYLNVCGKCDNVFSGHKRRVRCKLCENQVEERVEEKGEIDKFAIGFAEWMMKDGWRYNKHKGNWSKDVKWNSFITKTTDELLGLYKQSLTK
jgi:hypothetical protein